MQQRMDSIKYVSKGNNRIKLENLNYTGYFSFQRDCTSGIFMWQSWLDPLKSSAKLPVPGFFWQKSQGWFLYDVDLDGGQGSKVYLDKRVVFVVLLVL